MARCTFSPRNQNGLTAKEFLSFTLGSVYVLTAAFLLTSSDRVYTCMSIGNNVRLQPVVQILYACLSSSSSSSLSPGTACPLKTCEYVCVCVCVWSHSKRNRGSILWLWGNQNHEAGRRRNVFIRNPYGHIFLWRFLLLLLFSCTHFNLWLQRLCSFAITQNHLHINTGVVVHCEQPVQQHAPLQTGQEVRQNH